MAAAVVCGSAFADVQGLHMTRARAHRAWQHSGGDPTASAQSARVILADPNTEIFQHLVKTYQGEPDKYVESYLWVKKCIEKGMLILPTSIYEVLRIIPPLNVSEEDMAKGCQIIAEAVKEVAKES